MKATQHYLRGQSTAEYAVVIAIVLGAVVGMQTYVKRGMQAKLEKVTDNLTAETGASAGNPSIPTIGKTSQYEPYYAERGVTTINGSSGSASSVTTTYAGDSSGYGTSFSGVVRDVSRSGTTTEHGSETSQAQGWQ